MKPYFLAIMSAISTVVIDYVFHLLWTQPMETITYFFIKFFIAYFLSLLAFSEFSVFKGVIYTFVFTSIFATYYRFNEFIYKTGYGSRVPDIVFDTMKITFQEDTWTSITLWFLTHGLAFFIPIIALGYWAKE